MSVTMNMIKSGNSGEDVYLARRLIAAFEACDLAEGNYFDSDTEEYVK